MCHNKSHYSFLDPHFTSEREGKRHKSYNSHMRNASSVMEFTVLMNCTSESFFYSKSQCGHKRLPWVNALLHYSHFVCRTTRVMEPKSEYQSLHKTSDFIWVTSRSVYRCNRTWLPDMSRAILVIGEASGWRGLSLHFLIVAMYFYDVLPALAWLL